jgi:transcription antitermination factor NusG
MNQGTQVQLVETLSAIASPQLSWFAAYTHARHEKQVAQQLKDRGIDTFLPLYRSIRRWKDRRRELDLVLFPGYVFVRVSPSERLRVLQLPGVVRFVSFNGQPTAMPSSDVEALRRGLNQGVRAEHHPYLTLGRRVKIIAGPLAGAQGILLRTKPNSRVVISIDAIMRSVAVEIDEQDVMALF